MTLTPDEVSTIQDEHSAARAWLELQHERERPGMAPHRHVENRKAAAQLERDWPQAATVAAHAADHELGGLSPSLKRTRDAHRQRAGVTSQQAARARARRRSPTKRPAQPAPPAGRRSSPPRRAGGGGSFPRPRAAIDWAAPGALSWGQMAWQVAGWAVGLSMLYLFLTRGTGAVQTIATGVTGGVQRLVDPLGDPLGGAHLTPQQRGVAGGVPVQKAGESNQRFDQRMFDYLRTHPRPASTTRRAP